ncbi:hypothetical protein BURPS1655_B0008 [Burkholderia pseudomallei 1655]|nr:hypothetical protein BURPS1655_B0008 [Burkholderia pseudomallei 1655]
MFCFTSLYSVSVRASAIFVSLDGNSRLLKLPRMHNIYINACLEGTISFRRE